MKQKSLLLFIFALLLNTVIYSQNEGKRLQIADEFELSLTSTKSYYHNTTKGIVYSKTFKNKNSAYIKLHLNSFDLNSGDYVKVFSENGDEYIYSEKGKIVGENKEMISEFWTGTIWSDEITIELYSNGNNINHYGFNIDRVAYGHSVDRINRAVESLDTPFVQESICTADDKEAIVCYDGTEMGRKAEAVCRLLIGGGGLCTGWLLGCDGNVMTNNHCIGSVADANNTDFLFNYQYDNCAETVNATSDLQATSATFIQTSATLDFTLVKLPVNPTATYGYLSLSSNIASVGERIYIPQHPGGRRKEIAVNTDVGGDANGFAMVTGVGGGGNRVTYQCDTEGGSSGSPVIRYSDNLVVAIHNTGGCPNGAAGRSDEIIAAIAGNMPPCGIDDNNPPGPFVSASTTSSQSVIEGSDCSYTDIDLVIRLAQVADANADITLNITNGSATENEDFELLTNTISFLTGDTADKTSVLRIFNDGFIEGDEDIEITLSLNANGGNAQLSTFDKFNITINDDDIAVGSTQNTVIFEDDFETYNDFSISNVGQWTMIDNDGQPTWYSTGTEFPNEEYTGSFIVFNPAQTVPASDNGWSAYSGNKGFYCFSSGGDGAEGGATVANPENDDYIITPQLSTGTNSQISFWAKGLTDNYNGGERFRVLVGNGNTVANLTTELTPNPYAQPTTSWAEYTYNIPNSFDNSNIYVAINVVTVDEFVFMMDKFSVTSFIDTDVQTQTNNASTDDILIDGSGKVYAVDPTSNNIMADINVTNTDFGCTNIEVTRQGNSAQSYNGSTSPALVMDKTITITPTTINNSALTTVAFYFTEAELQGWESATGNSRNSLGVLKNDGSNTEQVSAVITTFGNDFKLEANFTTGINGTYYFGNLALLSNSSFNLNTGFSIYPNPVSNELNITSSKNNLPSSISIHNMLGQAIFKKVINSESDLKVNTSSLSNGMYFLTINTDTANQTIKFLKK